MLYLEIGNTRHSAWSIAFAFGLVVTGGLGLWAEWQGVFLSGWAIWFAFLTAFALVPCWVGLSVMLHWQANNRLDVAERKSRIYGRATPSAPTLTTYEPDPHFIAWQDALITFVLWSESLGSLTSTAHIGKSVTNAADWESLTQCLLESEYVYKVNGVPTAWRPVCSPARTALAIQAGKFETPEAAPPKVSPCPIVIG